MNSTSPANSSISTTSLVGGGGSSSNNTAPDEFHFPSGPISIQDRKDEALQVLKSDLMAALNEEVKSLDEDNWMFEGPRSRINLISRAVPSAYYAHLAAFRARYYIEGDTSDGGSTCENMSMSERNSEVRPLPVIKDNMKDVIVYC